MNIYAAVPLLGLFAYAFLMILSLRHPRRAERRAFFLYLASACIWSLVSFLLHLDYPIVHEYVLPGSKVLILAIVWMIVAYYCFLRVFVQRPAWPGVCAGMAFVLLVAVLLGLGLAPREATAAGGVIYIDHGWSIWLYVGGGLTLAIAAAHSLIRHYREVTTSIARSRVSYVLIGLVMVAGSLLTNISDTLSRYPIDQFGNLANALIISYAILKYELLDIKLILRRGLAYSALSIVLTTGYLVALYIVFKLAHLALFQATVIAGAALALVMVLVFNPLRDFVQERVDWLFYRRTYAYRKMLLDFSRQAANILALEDFSREMVHLIVNAVRARWGALLSPDSVSTDLRTEYIEGLDAEAEPQEVRLRHDNPLLANLVQEGKVLRREMIEVVPQGKGLWESEINELRAMEVSLLCPVLIRGTLTGIIVLGPKEGRGSYTDEEADLLLTMASEAAVAMENARMLDSLRQRQKAHEQLLSWVVAAQEEERQRIAAELHDSVAQWLVRASYQTQVASALASSSQGDGLRKELSDIEDTIDASVKELRGVLAGLRPPALEELGVPHAVKKELDGLQREGIAGSLDIQGEPVRLSPPTEIATYRIVQEALNNVRRHSRATKVDVQLRFDRERLRIQVSDDGVGFNVPRTLRSAVSVDHMGLLGMRQRAESLGGELQVESREGTGTRVTLQLSLNPKE
ncbi:histidine kinase [Chloroflexota bacterium]